MKLRQLGEFGFIERIAATAPHYGPVRIGIGDDAAATAPTPGYLSLTTSDMLVEGVHFDLSFTNPESLGRKSLAVNLSDLAAMGAIPRYFLLSLAIPPALDLEFLDAFMSGLQQQARRFSVALVGGDTCSSPGGLVISITAVGEQLPDRVVTRGGARTGDLIFVTGTVGDSALGLKLLRDGERTEAITSRHLDPEPRVAAGAALAESGLATAMIDISDGLLADLGHILKQSTVGARVLLDKVPLSPAYGGIVTRYAADAYALALGGGEDYELLFTARNEDRGRVLALMAACGVDATVIGEITAEGGLAVIAADGAEYRPSHTGYNHFSS